LFFLTFKKYENMELKDRIEQLKKYLNIRSNNELATKVGITRQTLDKVTNGDTKDPRSSFFIRFSEAFGVSLEWMITGKGNMMSEVSESDCQKQVNKLEKELHEIELEANISKKEISVLKNMISILNEKIDFLTKNSSKKE